MSKMTIKRPLNAPYPLQFSDLAAGHCYEMSAPGLHEPVLVMVVTAQQWSPTLSDEALGKSYDDYISEGVRSPHIVRLSDGCVLLGLLHKASRFRAVELTAHV